MEIHFEDGKSTKLKINFSLLSYLYIQRNVYICNPFAGVVELVDTLDLGSSAARCGSSSLPARTELKASQI